MLLQGELIFERVEDALDPLPQLGHRTMAAWLVTPVGADQASAKVAHGLLEVAPGKALVGQDAHPGPDRSPLQQPLSDLTLPELGVARHQATGMPSGVASTYSRKPQNQRWWLLQ